MGNLGLLILRLTFGGTMLLGHGVGKMMRFTELSTKFPDPLGVGVQNSLSLAIFAEVFCAFLVIIGLFTRLAAVPLVITMAVAYFVIHNADPFDNKELALMYFGAFACLMLTGPGLYSIDRK